MYKVKWDENNNGILLGDFTDEETINPPRPVFLQELQLLEITKKIKTVITDLPLCWCIDHKYYYKGKILCECKGANIYKKPEILFNDEFPYKVLEPINIGIVVKKNEEQMMSLENEAMDFIQDCFDKYNDKVDDVVVAFSGGKDSQVILDLVSRVIPADKFLAVFQDTDMELPYTYKIVKYTEEEYKYKFPNFTMLHAKSDKRAIDLWKQFGPPSRINRWCCSVMKTSLFRRTMKDYHNTNKQPKSLVFEGVRADESARRESYNRIGENVKHPNIVNCRAIFKWNTSEIFLYLIGRGIELNPAYRVGLTRVGCGVCPFASDWSEYIIRRVFPEISKEYVAVIEQMGKNLGINSQKKLNDYISSGNWQKNAGGRGIIQDNSRIDIVSKQPAFECIVTNPKSDWRKWLFAFSEFITREEDGKIIGELNYRGEIVVFTVIEKDNKVIFKADGMTNKMALTNYFTRILTKTAYCELCGVCEAECPTGALRIRETVELDRQMCVHCHKCLDVSTKGCIIAQRKQIYEGGTIKNSTRLKTSGVDKYSTFGLREQWVQSVFEEGDNWFGNYPQLGVKMIPAAINWMREAELIKPTEKNLSEQFYLLKDIYMTKPLMVWQIMWVNLCFNSAIVNSFVKCIKKDIEYQKDDILEIMKEEFPSLNETTIMNPISALINMFKTSPYGHQDGESISESNIYVVEMINVGRKVSIRRREASYISLPAMAYLLYKIAEKNDKYEFTVSEMMETEEITPYSVFNIDTSTFLSNLRALSQMQVLNADLTGGLENIHLNKEISSNEVLENMIKRL